MKGTRVYARIDMRTNLIRSIEVTESPWLWDDEKIVWCETNPREQTRIIHLEATDELDAYRKVTEFLKWT